MDTSKNNGAVDLKNSILQKSTILFVEDEDTLREEITGIFNGFFKEVLSAPNGKIGLEIYNTRKDDIDIIITDINMPEMNGIEFMTNIRARDMDIPILICTAFNETDSIIQAIKLKVDDYILKPVQMITTLKIIHKILSDRHNILLVKKHAKELENYKAIFDQENLIIETNLEGEIIYVNDLMCEASGYTKKELIGQKNSFLKHPDTTRMLAQELWNTIKMGQPWNGKIKNLAKDGSTFYVKTSIIPIFDENEEIVKYMSTGFLITSEEEEKQTLKKFIMQQKSEKVKSEHDIQARINQEVNIALKQAKLQEKENNQKLIELINDLDNEIKRLRQKHTDDNSRILTLEAKLKDANMKLENMQAGYQDRIDNLHHSSKYATSQFDSFKKKNMILENKLETAQETIQTMQKYIDGYRHKIEDLENIIAEYEEEIKGVPTVLKNT